LLSTAADAALERAMPSKLWAMAAVVAIAPAIGRAGTIDFRSSAFAGADQATSFSSSAGGLATTLTPEPDGAKLYWDATDGIGVRWDYEVDEIEGVERLAIRFSSPVQVTGILLTDLFNENGYLETGWYQLDGGAQIGFSADPGQLLGITNGEKQLTLDGIASEIRFGAPGYVQGQNHEFSVARVTYASPVPEPASALLTGIGGLVVGWAIRRRDSAA
jgi:hypothetical protein